MNDDQDTIVETYIDLEDLHSESCDGHLIVATARGEQIAVGQCSRCSLKVVNER